MRNKIIIITFLTFSIFLFPPKVHSEEINQEYYTLYYFKFDELGKEYFAEEKIYLDSTKEKNENILYFFKNFFEDDKISFISDGTKLLNIHIEDGTLIINVSEEINDYGGCYYESRLKEQIVKNALQIPEIKKVTLLIENELTTLKEGSIIYNDEK